MHSEYIPAFFMISVSILLTSPTPYNDDLDQQNTLSLQVSKHLKPFFHFLSDRSAHASIDSDEYFQTIVTVVRQSHAPD